MHGAHGFIILFSDGIKVATSFSHIASNSPEDADIGVRIDEYFDIDHIAQGLEAEEKDAFDDDDGNGIDMDGFVEESRMSFEIVERNVDRVSAFERFEVINEEFAFEAGGVIEVDFFSFFDRQEREISVVPIELNERAGGAEPLSNFSGERSFSGACAAGDADYLGYHNKNPCKSADDGGKRSVTGDLIF